MSDALRIGVDLGGTKIAAVALADDGTDRARERIATPRGDYAATVEAMARLVETIEARLGVQGQVGVGMPGTLSPATGLVKNANSTWLNGRALRPDVERRLAREVRFANDANCFALSEAIDGAAADAAVVFGVIVGTGAGGGLVIDRRVVVGANAIAGEWGHNPLPWPRGEELNGPRCWCGQRGCIETYLSGPGLARDHHAVTGHALASEAIVAAARNGDRDAEATVARYEDRMARALASVVNVVDPDVIVLGGGLSQIDRLYTNVAERFPKYVFSDRVDTRLAAPRYGAESGVRGAAWLW